MLITSFQLFYLASHAYCSSFSLLPLIDPQHKLEPSMAVPGTLFTNFFKEGDFHDSLMAPMFDSVVVPLRLNPGGAKYSGYAVAHCHVLAHEDEGMRFAFHLAVDVF